MSQYKPDGWVIIQLGESDYRVFGSWQGSYLYGDSWRVNSGIIKVTETEDAYFVYGESGSVYECGKNLSDNITAYNRSVLCHMVERYIMDDVDFSILSEYEAFEVLRKFIKEGE